MGPSLLRDQAAGPSEDVKPNLHSSAGESSSHTSPAAERQNTSRDSPADGSIANTNSGPSFTVSQLQSAPQPTSTQTILSSANSQAQSQSARQQDIFDDNAAKRPRLRLAHACDRCRRRKIRCSGDHPCTPCQQSSTNCTFNNPSRRVVKTKGNSERLSSTGGIKRPHSPTRNFTGLMTNRGENQTDLEARLATLESMLRNVPPNVHNAFLSTLDARLGSGTGVGIKEGGTGGEGIGVAVEALAGGNSQANLAALSLGRTLGYGLQNIDLNTYGQNPMALGWNSSPSAAGWLGGERNTCKKKEEAGMDELAKKMGGMSFFYEDEIGQAKWQGATSGFPLLHLLTAHNTPKEEYEGESEDADLSSEVIASPAMADSVLSNSSNNPSAPTRPVSLTSGTTMHTTSAQIKGRSSSIGLGAASRRAASVEGKRKERFFPDRTPRPHQTLNPEASWKVITGVIPPDLMDTLVRCYLSTSHLLWPFLHVPSFLADYANPAQWGEPGFTCFIVAVCTLSSRHVDDPRVRANPNDPSTAGKQYFELFKRLRDLPSADRPTLYSIQAAFLAAIYAFGLGNLSKAFSLQAESVTLCLDGGLHRSVDGYDHFDAVEKEIRKRTFWSIYSWDKQSAALFGRPPIIHLRDCDVTEPSTVDDENLNPEGIKDESINLKSRMCAFVATIRLHVILEGVIDSATQPSSFPTSPFLARAATTIAKRSPQIETLRDEEELLEEWKSILPKYWYYDNETANSRDPIRITQAERLHCLEHLVKMIIYRHRFSGFVAMPASTAEERARHLDLCKKAMQCALTIIADHVHISQRGMMTYYGVHVIHQLAQAGRTLVAVVLNCRNADFRPVIAACVEGLRSCVGLLRRFSGRYLCGLRSADIIDEFCRVCNIPVDSPRVPDSAGRPSPAWLRPVRKRVSTPPPTPDSPNSSGMMNFNPSFMSMAGQNTLTPGLSNLSATSGMVDLGTGPELEALFNTSAYFNTSGLENEENGADRSNTQTSAFIERNPGASSTFLPTLGGLGEASAPYDRFETLTPNAELGDGSAMLNDRNETTSGPFNFSNDTDHPMDNTGTGMGGNGSPITVGGGQIRFDYGMNGSGFGGESLATEGMDNVSDGLKKGAREGALSAATILSLMEEGSFDYGSIFTDQAP
ncbi:hypothetical protein L204_105675 [Cryptococcus depauperatus]|nr:nuclear protein [Cryptococcus depauperatus CBS 7855]